jgi:hypothetical protein
MRIIRTVKPEITHETFDEYQKYINSEVEKPLVINRTKESILSEILSLENDYRVTGEKEPREIIFSFSTRELSNMLRVVPYDFGQFLQALRMYKRQ